jgi:hypothetical protein
MDSYFADIKKGQHYQSDKTYKDKIDQFEKDAYEEFFSIYIKDSTQKQCK